jgi:hypothetical protein
MTQWELAGIVVTASCFVVFVIMAAYQIGYTRGVKMMGKHATQGLDELIKWVKSGMN